jgi:hypothetical protein
MAPIYGQRTTKDVGTQIPRDVAAQLYSPDGAFNPDEGAVLHILNNIPKGRREVKNFKFECYEEQAFTRQGTLSAANTTATSLTVSAALNAELRVGSVLYIPSTGERCLVTAVNNSTGGTTTVIRDMGGIINGDFSTEGTGGTIAASAQVILAGIALPEGGTAPEAVSKLPEASYNYTQRFKRYVNISDLLDKMSLYGESATLDMRTKEAFIELKKDIQAAFIMGSRSTRLDAVTGKTIRTTGGIMQHLQTNKKSVTSGILTMKVFDQFAELLAENNSSGLIYLVGGVRFASCLDNVPRSSIALVDPQSATSFGVKMKEIVTNKLVFRFILDKKTFVSTMGNNVLALDLDSGDIKYAYVEGLDVNLKRGVQNPKDSELANLIQAEVGLYMNGYGLDHSLASSTGEHRSPHGLLYTTATGGWDY